MNFDAECNIQFLIQTAWKNRTYGREGVIYFFVFSSVIDLCKKTVSYMFCKGKYESIDHNTLNLFFNSIKKTILYQIMSFLMADVWVLCWGAWWLSKMNSNWTQKWSPPWWVLFACLTNTFYMQNFESVQFCWTLTRNLTFSTNGLYWDLNLQTDLFPLLTLCLHF